MRTTAGGRSTRASRADQAGYLFEERSRLDWRPAERAVEVETVRVCELPLGVRAAKDVALALHSAGLIALE
jgi:hypothetical protein